MIQLNTNRKSFAWHSPFPFIGFHWRNPFPFIGENRPLLDVGNESTRLLFLQPNPTLAALLVLFFPSVFDKLLPTTGVLASNGFLLLTT